MNTWNKLPLVAFFAFLLLPLASGEILFERSLAEMGYEDFLVAGPEKTGCQEVKFLFPEISAEGKTYAIASIGIEPGPISEGKINVNASLNNSQIAALERPDFKCSGRLCWERLQLPKEKLLLEENSLLVCMHTGNSITSMLLSDQSKLGLYRTADFSSESSFRMFAEKTELVIGEKTKITMLLHNQGSGPSFAEVKFARPLAEDKNAFSVVEGEAYFSGIVEAGQQIEISYVVKPRLALPMSLPPAIVYYKNEFGEIESKFSNSTKELPFGKPVFLNVREPERRIEAFIVKEEETAFVGQAVGMMVAVKNNGSDPLYDLSVDLRGELGIEQPEKAIPALQPKETIYLAFTAIGLQPGETPVGCTVTYTDLNVSESHCRDSFVLFSRQEIGFEIYAGVALLAIAVIAYLYIMKTG